MRNVKVGRVGISGCMTNFIDIEKSLEHLIRAFQPFNKIVVIGYPQSGKTTLVNALSSHRPELTVIHSDDYIEHGWDAALYKMMDDMREYKPSPYLLEGVAGYRFLRKVEQLDLEDLKPDLIILCRSRSPIQQKHVQMCGNLDATMRDYNGIKKQSTLIIEYWTFSGEVVIKKGEMKNEGLRNSTSNEHSQRSQRLQGYRSGQSP